MTFKQLQTLHTIDLTRTKYKEPVAPAEFQAGKCANHSLLVLDSFDRDTQYSFFVDLFILSYDLKGKEDAFTELVMAISTINCDTYCIARGLQDAFNEIVVKLNQFNVVNHVMITKTQQFLDSVVFFLRENRYGIDMVNTVFWDILLELCLSRVYELQAKALSCSAQSLIDLCFTDPNLLAKAPLTDLVHQLRESLLDLGIEDRRCREQVIYLLEVATYLNWTFACMPDDYADEAANAYADEMADELEELIEEQDVLRLQVALTMTEEMCDEYEKFCNDQS